VSTLGSFLASAQETSTEQCSGVLSCVQLGVPQMQYCSTLWLVVVVVAACGNTTEDDSPSSSPAELGGASGSGGTLISAGSGGAPGGGMSGTTMAGQPGSLCGNGVLDPGEQCDGSPPGECTPECCLSTNHSLCWPRPPACGCGDGVVAGDEQCDDGNVQNGDGCNQLCELEVGNPCGYRSCRARRRASCWSRCTGPLDRSVDRRPFV
jgi:cysteine-rich repeat protein